MQANQVKKSWVLGACFSLLFPCFLHGQLFQVDQLSEPAGYLSESEAIQQGTNHPSVSPTLSSNGFAFGYWTINDVRQAGPDGRSLTQVSSVIAGATTYKAFYFNESEDSDSDGIKDWFEYRMWGDLTHGPTEDPDGDGFSNQREDQLGQDPLIFDQVEDGGIAGRLSTGFVYADTSMVLATIKSDPAGFVTETSNFQEMNSSVSTSSLHGETNGYQFAYWSVNGVRQAGPTGVSMSKVDQNITQTTNIIAHYLASSEDSDSDGVMDWFELYQFGNLNQGPNDDPDGDGFSNKREGELGQEATIVDLVEDGGIAGRLSTGFVYADTSMVLATVKSDPAGFVSESNTYLEQNGSLSTSSLHGETNGYQFAYWSVNGVRQAGPTGVASSKVDFEANSSTNTTQANFYHGFKHINDAGADDYLFLNSNATKRVESANVSYWCSATAGTPASLTYKFTFPGPSSSIFAKVPTSSYNFGANSGSASVWGSTDNSTWTLLLDNPTPQSVDSYLTYSENLPASLLGTQDLYLQIRFQTTGSMNILAQFARSGENATSDAFFVDANYSTSSSSAHEIIAHYLPSGEDSDSDGVMDWFELYQFGNLDKGPDDDPDGDGFSNKREGELGQEATIFDLVEDGGIAGRLSTGVLYFQQQNRPPSHLELNSNIAYLNKEANQTIGTFTPTDPDDPNLLRTYNISLVDGNGSTHNALFNLSGMQLRAAQSLTTEGNFSIRIKVSDDENASLEKNFTILAIDPLQDDDGDGLGYEAELIAGTNPNNPDSDGDGASDGSEVSAGTNPLDASLFPNRPPADLNSTAPLVIAENQPIGTVVGEFNATDPDGDSLTYHLVSGDNNNSLFTLDSNGILFSDVVFDFEKNESSFFIMVQVTDEQNSSFFNEFTVSISDIINEPPFYSANLRLWLDGKDINGNGTYNSNYIEGKQTTTWHDKSGFKFHASQSNVSDKPLFSEGGGLLFDGISDHLTLGSNFLFSENDGMTIVVSAINSEKNSTGFLYHFGNLAQQCVVLGSTSTSVYAGTSTNHGGIIEKYPINETKNMISSFVIRFNDSQSVYSNQSLIGTENISLTSLSDSTISNSAIRSNDSGPITIGGQSKTHKQQNRFFEGIINEVIVFDTALSTLELKTVESYLVKKWNNRPEGLTIIRPLNIYENQPVGTIIGEFNATDPDANATLSYALIDGNGSSDNHLFSLEQNGNLKTATVFDFENNQSNYSIRVQVKDEYNASLEKVFSVQLENLNENPVIHSANIGNKAPTLLGLVTVPENSTFALEVNASDPDRDPIHFYKTAGLDRDQFDLNASTGILTFKNPPDFENPTDADGNNSYAVWFRAEDGNGGYSEKRLTVRVTNVVEDFDQDGIEDFYDLDDDNDGFSDIEEVAYGSDPRDQNSTANAAPQITLATEFPNQIGENGVFHIGHPENQTDIIRVTASDSDGDELHFSIHGNQNLPLLEINATTGDLRFKNPPDFENRGGHNKNGVYGVVIRVSDGKAHHDQPIFVWVQNQNEPPTDLNTSVPLEVLENQPAGSFVGNFDAIDPDANSTLTFSLVEGNQSDTNFEFILDSNGTLRTAVSFDYESQTEEGNPLQILVRVSDEQNASLDKQFAVLILDEYEPFETPPAEDQNESMDRNATLPPFIDGNYTDDSNATLPPFIDGYYTEDDNGTLPPFIDGNYTEDNNATLPPILDDNQSLVEDNSTLPPAIEPEPEPEFNPYAWIPIIQTDYPEILEDGSIRMSGRVLYDGGGNISEFGFLLAPTLRIKQHSPDTIRMEANGTVDGFTLIIPESPYPHRLYLQAYSMNEAGIGVGQRRRLKIPEAPLEWWGDAIQAEGDWLQSPWFGAFKYYERGWLYHGELGWLFASPAEDGVWLWGSANQWIWTNDGVYPYHYRWNDAGWGIWQRSESGVIRTYNYTTGRYEN